MAVKTSIVAALLLAAFVVGDPRSGGECEIVKECLPFITEECMSELVERNEEGIIPCCDQTKNFFTCLGDSAEKCLLEVVGEFAEPVLEGESFCNALEKESCFLPVLTCGALITAKCEETLEAGNPADVEGCCQELIDMVDCIGRDLTEQCLPATAFDAVQAGLDKCVGIPTAVPSPFPTPSDPCLEVIADCAVFIRPKCYNAALAALIDEEIEGLLECCNEVAATISCLEVNKVECENPIVQAAYEESLTILTGGQSVCEANPTPTPDPSSCEIVVDCGVFIRPSCVEAVVAGDKEVIASCCNEIGNYSQCLGDQGKQCLPTTALKALEVADAECKECEIVKECLPFITEECMSELVERNEEGIIPCCDQTKNFFTCLGDSAEKCLLEVVGEFAEPVLEGESFCNALEKESCFVPVLTCGTLVTARCQGPLEDGNPQDVEGCCQELIDMVECIGRDLTAQCLPPSSLAEVQAGLDKCVGIPTAVPSPFPTPSDSCLEVIADCAVFIRPKCYSAAIAAIVDDEIEGLLECCNEVAATLSCLEVNEVECTNPIVEQAYEQNLTILTAAEDICKANPTPTPDPTSCEIVVDCGVFIRPSCIEAIVTGDKEVIASCCNEIGNYSQCLGDQGKQCLPTTALKALENAEGDCDDDQPSGVFFQFPCKGKATYKVTVAWSWSSATHPNSYPAGGGISPFVVASHGMEYTLWAELGYASKGVQMVAETGGTSGLVDELKAENYRNVFQRVVDATGASGTESRTYMLEVQTARAYLSGIAMLAPSPDWFSGFSQINTCDVVTGEFIDHIEGPLGAYDAGTDGGESFTAEDMPLKAGERRPITSVLDEHFEGVYVGKYVLQKVVEP